MTEAGFKYAELPSGKVLRFREDVSDKEIQRAVKRELGLAQDEMVDAIQQFSDHVGDLAEDVKTRNARHKEAMDAVVDALSQSAGRLGGTVGDAIAAMTKSNEKLTADLAKALNAHVNLVSKLHATVDGLNKTLDAALGQSLEAMDRANQSAAIITKSVDSSVVGLKAMADQLVESVEVMHALKTLRKRAYRNRDGSWTMEPIG